MGPSGEQRGDASCSKLHWHSRRKTNAPGAFNKPQPMQAALTELLSSSQLAHVHMSQRMQFVTVRSGSLRCPQLPHAHSARRPAVMRCYERLAPAPAIMMGGLQGASAMQTSDNASAPAVGAAAAGGTA